MCNEYLSLHGTSPLVGLNNGGGCCGGILALVAALVVAIFIFFLYDITKTWRLITNHASIPSSYSSFAVISPL